MVNGEMVVNNAEITKSQVQGARAVVPRLHPGMNSISVQLCNPAGCSSSEPWVIDAKVSAFQQINKLPDPPLILKNTHWSQNHVQVSWMAGAFPGKYYQISVNGVMSEQIAVEPRLGQGATHRMWFEGVKGGNEATVTLMLCNDLGCSPSQPYTVKRF